MPNPKANAPAALNSFQRVVSFRMVYSFAFDPDSRQQTARPSRVFQQAKPTSAEAAIYRRFLGVAVTESFAMFRRQAEPEMNFENAPGMNCVNIVESAANVWPADGKGAHHGAL